MNESYAPSVDTLDMVAPFYSIWIHCGPSPACIVHLSTPDPLFLSGLLFFSPFLCPLPLYSALPRPLVTPFLFIYPYQLVPPVPFFIAPQTCTVLLPLFHIIFPDYLPPPPPSCCARVPTYLLRLVFFVTTNHYK